MDAKTTSVVAKNSTPGGNASTVSAKKTSVVAKTSTAGRITSNNTSVERK